MRRSDFSYELRPFQGESEITLHVADDNSQRLARKLRKVENF